MIHYFREASEAAQCSTLRIQLAHFVKAIDFIVTHLHLTAHEWRLEQLFTYEVIRVHRIRFDEKLRSFGSLTDDFRSGLKLSGLRERSFQVIDKCHDEVTDCLLRMDSNLQPLADWQIRLSNAEKVVDAATRELRNLLNELQALESAKQTTVTRIRQDLERISQDF